MTSRSCDRDVITGPAPIQTLGLEAAACTAHRARTSTEVLGAVSGKHYVKSRAKPEPGQDDLLYDDWYIDDPQEPTIPPHEIILPCFPAMSDGLYHLILAPVSLCTLLLLCFLVRRQKLCTSLCWGVPGVLSPLNLLEGPGNNWIPCAALGLLFSSIFRMLLDPTALNFMPNSDGPYKELWKIFALFYYPALYYPLLASHSVQKIPGFVAGTILSWMHCGALIWQKAECPQTPQFYRYYSLLATVPQICCLLLLSIIYPTLLLQKVRQPAHAEQVMSGGKRRLLKKKLQVCESQKS
ncbi:unnamed protein product [Ranitomeya imitator]|uniref:Receptor for retinol uptake STRA6 n=1 Tax=Ranitomeya imitator TaxID=111125 RepID=A0ABN9LLL0_9NEOB|nr:unnamed protein product [Ranitomeya imitator]